MTFFGIPSFVVTLAGLIAWQGAQLKVLGETGSVNLPIPGTITDIAFTFYSDTFGMDPRGGRDRGRRGAPG